MANPNQQPGESESLRSILGTQSNIQKFFDEIWQKSCAVFTVEHRSNPSPLDTLIGDGFDVTSDLMSQTHRIEEMPLFFQNTNLLSHEEVRVKYTNGDNSNDRNLCFPAFLDGCSIVLNHADLRSFPIAHLCNDLQRSFPHAYANAYITPRCSQAVPAHADDRDVFIVQIYGSKTWTVYQRVPIPYPYPDEQVGKAGHPVPEAVLQGPVLLQHTLVPGSVLYMPRGYVHQASTTADSSSCHVTVALATHDWTLAGALQSAGRAVWTRNVAWRQALPRQVGTAAVLGDQERQQLQEQIDAAIDALRREVTVEAVEEAMRVKLGRHNATAREGRRNVVLRQEQQEVTLPPTASRSGPEASNYVRLSTVVRATTEEEKAAVQQQFQGQVGLLVADDYFDEVLACLQHLKAGSIVGKVEDSTLCDLTKLCVARRCVELGALALAD